MNYLKEGVNLSLYTLIPSMFVFLIFSDFFIKTNSLAKIFKPFGFIFSKLFNIDKSLAPVLFMSLICGYPVGARLLNDLVLSGDMDKKTGERMLSYCVNSGPAFLIGSVSIPLFHSVKPGIYIFLCHFISFLFIGIVSGFKKEAPIIKVKAHYMDFSSALVLSVKGAVKSMTSICAFVILFYGIIGILKENILVLLNPKLSSILVGILEVSNGVFSIGDNSFFFSFLTITAFTAFGGFCVHLQIKAAVFKSGIKLKKFYFYRIIYTMLSVGCAFILYRYIDLPISASSVFETKLNLSYYSHTNSILLIILAISLLCCDKKSCIIKKRSIFCKRRNKIEN